MSDEYKLQGLGGWLILIGIGVVITPVKLLFTLLPLYAPLFTDGNWEALTAETSLSYRPYFDLLAIGEMTYNGIYFLLSLWMIYLFFSKHYLFPKIFMAVIVATLLFIPLDAWVVTLVFPGDAIFTTDVIKELLKSVLVAVVWIPYMLLSKRVNLTFVEHKPNTDLSKGLTQT